MQQLRKTNLRRTRAFLLASALFGVGSGAGFTQTPAINQSWAYLLVNDSYLLDDCPICDRLSVPVPMRGTFNLRLISQSPVSSSYTLENIRFTAGSRPYTVTGSGTFEIGGEVAVTLKMDLHLEIDDGLTNAPCFFTNSATMPDRSWPMMDITVTQTNGTLGQVYTLRLAAAPIREIWFSTVSGFTTTAGQPPVNYVEGGDLISTTGRVVKRNADLFTSVGAYPPVPDLGLNAVDVLPGAEIAFALGSDISSTTLGQLQHGDLLSTKGRIIRRNQDLLAPFMTQPTTNDVGLDAVQVLDNGEILFSIATNVFSMQLDAMLQSGDLLSSNGAMVRTNQQLLAHFKPFDPKNDYGLKSLYVWPGGEIWFSPETGFQDLVLGPIQPGDLLSDQGYVVFHNLDLLKAFAPSSSLTNFGLDALFIVSDATPSAPVTVLAIRTDSSTGTANLIWEGMGRVFQVERADAVSGPFKTLSDILPDLFFDEPGALTNRSRSYYRLRQW